MEKLQSEKPSKSVEEVLQGVRNLSRWVKMILVFCVASFAMLQAGDQHRWHAVEHQRSHDSHDRHHHEPIVDNHRQMVVDFELPEEHQVQPPPRVSKETVAVVSANIEGRSGDIVTIEMQLVTTGEKGPAKGEPQGRSEELRHVHGMHLQTRIVQGAIIVGFITALVETTCAAKIWVSIALLSQFAVTSISGHLAGVYIRDTYGGWPGLSAMQPCDKQYLRDHCFWLLTLWLAHGIMVYLGSELQQLINANDESHIHEEEAHELCYV